MHNDRAAQIIGRAMDRERREAVAGALACAAEHATRNEG